MKLCLASLRLPLAGLVLLVTGFWGGASAMSAGLLPGNASGQAPWVNHTFRVFWEAWNRAQEHYVDRDALDETRMTYGAVQGMLDALGDAGHSRFLSPEALKEENQALSGQLEGIGAEVNILNGHPVIVAPLAGSPAEKAGIRARDVIVQVNDQNVVGLALAEVIKLIRGPAGTSVKLTVLHQGATALEEVEITRGRIPVPGVAWAMLPDTQVAHIYISQFKSDVTKQVGEALITSRNQGARAVILDLRNDPGGIRDEAIGVASHFVDQGLVLQERNARGDIHRYHARPGGYGYDVPLVVLINEGTASAGEIVAGAIQDHGRAKIIGTKSFGTGTVLSTYTLSDGSAIRLGTSEWLTPNGREIWHQGITPDIEVRLPFGTVPLTPPLTGRVTGEQLRGSHDAQLLRALQELGVP